MVDFRFKMDDILGDYYQMLGEFDLITNTINNCNISISDTDSDEVKKIKEAQKNKILQDLGRIMELAFKYILKLKRLELYPLESYYSNNAKNNNGFREKETFTKSVVNDLANMLGVPQSNVESQIYSVSGVGPDSHNFSYLYKIIEILFPKINKSLKDFFEYILIYKMANEEVDDDLDKSLLIVFPAEIYSTNYRNAEQINQETQERVKKRLASINENGDIFTRLRYFSNNPNDKNFNMEEIYELVHDVVIFIKSIHLNNNQVDLDSRLLFASYILLTKNNTSRFTKSQIVNLIQNKKIQQDPEILITALFYGDLPYEEIKGLLELDSLDGLDYTFLFTSNITKDLYVYFSKKGYSDPGDIFYFVDIIKEINKKLDSIIEYMDAGFDDEESLGRLIRDTLSANDLNIIKMFPEYFANNSFIKRISRGRIVNDKIL